MKNFITFNELKNLNVERIENLDNKTFRIKIRI